MSEPTFTAKRLLRGADTSHRLGWDSQLKSGDQVITFPEMVVALGQRGHWGAVWPPLASTATEQLAASLSTVRWRAYRGVGGLVG